MSKFNLQGLPTDQFGRLMLSLSPADLQKLITGSYELTSRAEDRAEFTAENGSKCILIVRPDQQTEQDMPITGDQQVSLEVEFMDCPT